MELTLLGSVLVVGFLGSWHCGVMCGPLSCNFKKYSDFFSYHLGRLISYIIISGLLYLGMKFLLNSDSRNFKMGISLIFGLMFIIFGLMQMNILKNRNIFFKYYKFQFRIFEMFKSVYQKFPVVLGLLTGLFPCAWLYSFLMLSSQMKSWFYSLLVIILFWLTSLPAFIVMTGFLQNLIKKSPSRYQTLSGAVLIFAGLLSILGHWSRLMVD